MKDASKAVAAAIAFGVVLIIVGLIFATMAIFGIGTFQRSTANFRGKTSQIEKTRANGDYRIANYDWFFAQCGAIQAKEDQIEVFAEDTSPIGEANLRAVKASRASLIRAYNAKATAEGTSGQFRSSDLPYQIQPSQEKTTCVAS